MADESPRSKRVWRALVGVALLLLVGGGVGYALWDWGGPPAPAAEPAPSADDDPPTLAGAISKARQWPGRDPDATTARSLVLLGWANRHLAWSDVEVHPDETSFDLVEKGVDAQMGKRMCVSGKVVRLNLVRTDSQGSGAGVLVTGDGRSFAFRAARNLGSVEEGGSARLCGVVTGWNQAESDLGPPRAVVLVGMFEADRELARDR
jgi:hypothetical protein